MLDIQFKCGNCDWYVEIVIPEDKKGKVTPRGFCHVNPPAVFPVPQVRKSSLALAQGQEAPGETSMVPLMMRPVLEAHEDICAKYQPNQTIRAMIDEYKKQNSCSGNEDCKQGDCGGCKR